MPGRLLLLFLVGLLLGSFANAQSDTAAVLVLNRDNYYKTDFNRKIWRFSPMDLPNGGDTALRDESWPLTTTDLTIGKNDQSEAGFRGIGWLRLRFISDSNLTGTPIAIELRQDGASEIYLDGVRLERYGVLTPADSAEYYSPANAPLIFVLMQHGRHVLAIRYANWRYLENKREHYHSFAGFKLSMSDSISAIESDSEITFFGTLVLVLMATVFFTLALVHFILFLYYRAERPNLRFALFAFCMGALFMLPLGAFLVNDPVVRLYSGRGILYVGAVTCFTLTYLLDGLFRQRQWRIYLLTVLCLLVMLLNYIGSDSGPIGLLVLILLVSLDSIARLVGAMFRRQPGARILGFGLLLLLLSLLSIFGFSLALGGINLNGMSPAGIVIISTFLLGIVTIPLSMSAYLAWRFAHISRDLKKQLQEVETLSADKQRLLESRQEELESEVALRTDELRREKQQSDDLLLNILPAEVAAELKEKGSSEARHYDNVSVLFTDFVDFTQFSETMTPTALVAEIDACFKAFDGIMEKHGLEKIKTVGDAYIAVSGLPAAAPDHAQLVVRAAVEILAFMNERREQRPGTFRIRLGVHSGPVVAGIVGIKKFAYDIWGDTVNTAARMEQHSEAGQINISAATYELVKDEFACTFRGSIAAKHKGELEMYFVASAAPAPHSPPPAPPKGE